MKESIKKFASICFAACVVICWFGVLAGIVLVVFPNPPEHAKSLFLGMSLLVIPGVIVWFMQLKSVLSNTKVLVLTTDALLFFTLSCLVVRRVYALGGIDRYLFWVLAAGFFLVSVYWLYQLGKDCGKKAWAAAMGQTYESFLPAKAEEFLK